MRDDETLEEWTARLRRERTGAAEPPAAVTVASWLLIGLGVLTVALGLPGSFRSVDLLNERTASISTVIAGVVRIALGFWLRGGSRRAYSSAIMTALATAVVTGLAYSRTGDGIRGLEYVDLVIIAGPVALLVLPSSLRWRRELRR